MRRLSRTSDHSAWLFYALSFNLFLGEAHVLLDGVRGL